MTKLQKYIKECEDLINLIKSKDLNPAHEQLINIIAKEPHHDLFLFENLPCFILRHKLNGNYCGYVGVPKTSKLHGKSQEEMYNIDDDIINVHYGLTFSNYLSKFTPKYEDYWFFGFDCNHSGDFTPSYLLHGFFDIVTNTTYKDHSYLKREVINLASQLLQIEPELKGKIRKQKIKKILNDE